jgi:ubiquinone/menaquinone biosynthesis C-methylase UbiE
MCAHLQAKLVFLRHSNVDVVVADAIKLPLADESVDVVLSNYCLHHVNDADSAKRCARPGVCCGPVDVW